MPFPDKKIKINKCLALFALFPERKIVDAFKKKISGNDLEKRPFLAEPSRRPKPKYEKVHVFV